MKEKKANITEGLGLDSFETKKWLLRPPVNASEDVVPLLLIGEEQSHSERSGEVSISHEISISDEMMI